MDRFSTLLDPLEQFWCFPVDRRDFLLFVALLIDTICLALMPECFGALKCD